MSVGKLVATATFTGLPVNNSDFGPKKATMHFNGREVVKKEKYEVFYPRDDDNHPGGQAGSPNWFYYWGQVYVNNNVVYDSSYVDTAKAPGMLEWSYISPPNKNIIIFGLDNPKKGFFYGVGNEFSGIDMYIGLVLHEEMHIDQIMRADTLVTMTPGTPWQYGWSFNQWMNHNHWTLGTDGQPGIAGIDDDSDGLIDNFITSGPGELGKGTGDGHDDDLTEPTCNVKNWPAAWPIPIPLIYSSDYFECEAINHTNNSLNDDDYKDRDWGSPGKNHNTLTWDD